MGPKPDREVSADAHNPGTLQHNHPLLQAAAPGTLIDPGEAAGMALSGAAPGCSPRVTGRSLA